MLLEESEDEAAIPAESVGGFFLKHGTFMGAENEISQNSDAAGSDSDYDTDLDTEGELLSLKFAKRYTNKLNIIGSKRAIGFS